MSVFAVVVAGLVALDALVVLALVPQLARLSHMSGDEVRGLALAARLREQISRVRREVLAGETRGPGAVAGLAAVVSSWRDAATEFEALAASDQERRSGTELRQAVACSAAVLEPVRAGDVESLADRRAALLDATAVASVAADDAIIAMTREVRTTTWRVHDALVWLTIVASLVTVAIIVAASFLLRRALDGDARRRTLLERHANEMASFAARAAHELRTPLQTLMLSISAARQGNASALERAESAAGRLRDTIREILAFSRSGVRPLEPGNAAVAPVVTAVVDEVRQQADQAAICVTCEVGDTAEVSMSPGYLRTVLTNLVGNGVKYSAGRPEARVAVRAVACGQVVRVEVEDNGPGIPEAMLPRIAEPFFRASRDREGYGLGLATVKRLVDAHGGRFTIDSAEGRGTRVVVDLPASASGTLGKTSGEPRAP